MCQVILINNCIMVRLVDVIEFYIGLKGLGKNLIRFESRNLIIYVFANFDVPSFDIDSNSEFLISI